jgi:UDP-N-acetylmuramoylalanine--D-glutamate ligase
MFIEEIKSKNTKVAVFGLGKSGKAAVKFLTEYEIPTLVWDGNQDILKEMQLVHKTNKYLTFQNFNKYNWKEIECLILAAGVPLHYPIPHNIVKLARKHKCPIISDVEVLYRSFPNNTFIGVTGTNGKSTTTALLGHIFKKSKIKSDFGGNLGNTATLGLEKFEKEGVYIIEMSSYMLDLLDETKFNAAILLNITPDHLDRHGGMKNYIASKASIFANQDETCVGIISVDCPNAKKVYETLQKDKKHNGRLIPISVNKILNNGISFVNGTIYNYINNKNEHIEVGELKYLKGQHNAENVICAFAAAVFYGISINETLEHVMSFKGLDHRMQLIRSIGNINFINDSKATNDKSTEQALKANDNIYWILGGRPKEGGIKSLKKYFNKVKYAFLIGEATEEFAKTLKKGNVKYFKCGGLENAFKKAYEMAKNEPKKEKINVLLSPACASFDQWKNFEKRGEFFVKMVKEVKE